MLFRLTPVGGGIPHGVFLDSGGNKFGLTKHRPDEEGRHAPPCPPATTLLTSQANVNTKGENRSNLVWIPEPSIEPGYQLGTTLNTDTNNLDSSSKTKTDCKPRNQPRTNTNSGADSKANCITGLNINSKINNESVIIVNTNMSTKTGTKPVTDSTMKSNPRLIGNSGNKSAIRNSTNLSNKTNTDHVIIHLTLKQTLSLVPLQTINTNTADPWV